MVATDMAGVQSLYNINRKMLFVIMEDNITLVMYYSLDLIGTSTRIA